MKKIESARIVEEQKGNCSKVRCFGCFNEEWCDNNRSHSPSLYCSDKLRLATAYIKRHEQKCKKRIIPKYTADVKPDKTNAECKRVVTLPKEKPEIKSTIQCYKCVSVQTCKRKEKELSILPACDGYISNESMNYIHTVDPNEKKVESVLTTTPDMSKPKPLEIAKAIRDNGYKCSNINGFLCRNVCPIYRVDCGASSYDMPATALRKQLIDSYIKANEPACEHLVS